MIREKQSKIAQKGPFLLIRNIFGDFEGVGVFEIYVKYSGI